MLRAGKIVKSGIFTKIILRNKAFADYAQWAGPGQAWCSAVQENICICSIGHDRTAQAAAEYKSTMTCLSEVSSNSDLCAWCVVSMVNTVECI